MKKTIAITLLVFALVISYSISAVPAAEQAYQTKRGECVEKNWQQALKTQVALAKARVALIEARSELWLNKNKEAALRSLEEVKIYLNEAYQSADKTTRKRISDLENQVETVKNAVQEKGQQAALDLTNLVYRGDAALSAAIAETQVRAIVLRKSAATFTALTQAKAAQLKAKIALEIDQAPEKAKLALTEAEGYLSEAKASATQRTGQGIAKLQSQTREAKKALTGNVKEARGKLDTLIAHTDKQLQAYGTRIKESKEANLFHKRYAYIEAQAALLKAQFAASTQATIDQAHVYLEEAKVWYSRTRNQGEKTINKAVVNMEKRINEAKITLTEKSKDAHRKFSELLIKAAEIVKGEE